MIFSLEIILKNSNFSCSNLDCDEMLNSTYKYILSLEGSYCSEAVPNTFLKNSKNLIVPIVMGTKNLKYFWPDGSYFDLNQYENLSKFISDLKAELQDDAKYFSRFWWRGFYKSEPHNPFCTLCERLHEPNIIHYTQHYQNISE